MRMKWNLTYDDDVMLYSPLVTPGSSCSLVESVAAAVHHTLEDVQALPEGGEKRVVAQDAQWRQHAVAIPWRCPGTPFGPGWPSNARLWHPISSRGHCVVTRERQGGRVAFLSGLDRRVCVWRLVWAKRKLIRTKTWFVISISAKIM